MLWWDKRGLNRVDRTIDEWMGEWSDRNTVTLWKDLRKKRTTMPTAMPSPRRNRPCREVKPDVLAGDLAQRANPADVAEQCCVSQG